jgi:transcriptional regulator with XRE-family HTH domain
MNEIARILGKKIKLIRIEKDLSQLDLSFNAGVNRTYLGKVERGEVNITIDKFNDICRALGHKPSDILSKIGM